MKPRDIIKEYSPKAGPKGANTKENLAYWSKRASANSYHSPNPTDGRPKLRTSDGKFAPGVRRII